jgi:predicted DNA-binding protein
MLTHKEMRYTQVMATTTTPEPFTFSELYDLKVASIRQAKEAHKALDRLSKSTGRTAATTNAIERWTEVKNTYDALVERVQDFIDVKLDENDRHDEKTQRLLSPAHFRSPAKTFNSQGEHTGPGEWLTIIRTVNGIAKDEGIPGPKLYSDGTAPIFGSPESDGDWWAGGYVEEYPDARVIHRTDDTVSIFSKTDRGADLIRRAAASHGWRA